MARRLKDELLYGSTQWETKDVGIPSIGKLEKGSELCSTSRFTSVLHFWQAGLNGSSQKYSWTYLSMRCAQIEQYTKEEWAPSWGSADIQDETVASGSSEKSKPAFSWDVLISSAGLHACSSSHEFFSSQLNLIFRAVSSFLGALCQKGQNNPQIGQN